MLKRMAALLLALMLLPLSALADIAWPDQTAGQRQPKGYISPSMPSCWMRSSSQRAMRSPAFRAALFFLKMWDSTRLPSSPSHQNTL